MTNSPTFRLATIEDTDFLLFCRNEPSIRIQLFGQDEVSRETHTEWMKNNIGSPNAIVAVGELDKPIAYVRAKKLDDSWEIGYGVLPEYRNKGYGSFFVKEMIKLLPDTDISAFIREDNPASQNFAKKMGFYHVKGTEWRRDKRKITNSFVVLSHYDQDISWLPEFTDNYVVYNKLGEVAPNIDKDKVIKANPLGQGAHDYLSYIIDNYDSLPRLVMFVKGNIFPRHLSQEAFEKICNNNYFTPIEDFNEHKVAYPTSLLSADGGHVEWNNSWYSNERPHKYFADYNDLLFKVYKDAPIPVFVRFAPAGCYIVERERIHKLPKKTYEFLRGLLDYTANPAEAHILERMFYTFWNSNFEPQ